MKIEINFKIILVIILFFLFNNFSIYIIFLISIFLHEISHLISGILIGGKPKSIHLNPFGASLEFYSFEKDNFFYKIIFYFSGPITNLIIAMFCFFSNLKYYKFEIFYTNSVLFLFNLLPILPLDGGKIIKEILKPIVGFEKSSDFIIILSKTFLVTISFLYSIFIIKIKNVNILFLLIYLWYLYFVEEKKYSIYKKTNESIKKLKN